MTSEFFEPYALPGYRTYHLAAADHAKKTFPDLLIAPEGLLEHIRAGAWQRPLYLTLLTARGFRDAAATQYLLTSSAKAETQQFGLVSIQLTLGDEVIDASDTIRVVSTRLSAEDTSIVLLDTATFLNAILIGEENSRVVSSN